MAEIIHGNFTGGKQQKPKTELKPEEAPCYQLKISLTFSDPLIWRRFRVPSTMTLAGLHRVIQTCMGWQDAHLHQFLVGKIFYDQPVPGKRKEYDESKFQLHELEEGMHFLFTYIYDTGDGWEHEIELEEVIPPGQGECKPVLLEGSGACPPEDVGGIPGYERFLNALKDPGHKEHREMVNWYGGEDFDPDFLDIQLINDSLKTLG